MVFVEAWCDGAARRQGVKTPQGVLLAPEAALGLVIARNSQRVVEFARGIGPRSNNEAEYEAIIHTLLICLANPDLQSPAIYSDSLIAINQINGVWDCADTVLQPLLLTIREIQEIFPFSLRHAKRTTKGIRYADRLAHLFLDELEAEQRKMTRKD